MNKTDRFLARLCLVIFALLLTLALIEAAANVYLWHIASEDDFKVLASIDQIKARYGDEFFVQSVDRRQLSWSPHPYLGYYPTPNFRKGENRHNSLGYRGGEFPLRKAEAAYRIVTIGGSTTYSIDVQDHRDSYPSQLESHLRASGFEGVEVINAGIAGHNSYHNLINLAFRVLPLEPDLVILYQGWNDIETRFVYPYERYLGDNSGAESPYVSDTFMPAIAEYSTALRILGIRAGWTRSHAALEWHFGKRADSNHMQTYQSQFKHGQYPRGVFREASAMDMLANNPPVHFERNLLNMIAASGQQGVSALLVTQVSDPNYHARTGGRTNIYFSSEPYIAGMAQHNQITRAAAAATDAALFDLAAVFPDESALFTDGLHMNRDGNRVRAQLIGDFIIAEFLS